MIDSLGSRRGLIGDSDDVDVGRSALFMIDSLGSRWGLIGDDVDVGRSASLAASLDRSAVVSRYRAYRPLVELG